VNINAIHVTKFHLIVQLVVYFVVTHQHVTVVLDIMKIMYNNVLSVHSSVLPVLKVLVLHV